MNNYYCPFCSSKYELHQKLPNGEMVCGHCGEELFIKPIISRNQVIGLITSIALLAPLIISSLLILDIRNYKTYPQKKNPKGLISVSGHHEPLTLSSFKLT